MSTTLKNKNYHIQSSQTLNEQENKTRWYYILREGKIHSFKYPDLFFEKNYIKKIVENFNNKVMQSEPYIDLMHSKTQAYGKILALKCSEEEGILKLYAKIRFNKKGLELIKEESFRYLSAEIGTHMNTQNGELFQPVLKGIALTNDPVFSEMPPLALSKEGQSTYDFLELSKRKFLQQSNFGANNMNEEDLLNELKSLLKLKDESSTKEVLELLKEKLKTDMKPEKPQTNIEEIEKDKKQSQKEAYQNNGNPNQSEAAQTEKNLNGFQNQINTLFKDEVFVSNMKNLISNILTGYSQIEDAESLNKDSSKKQETDIQNKSKKENEKDFYKKLALSNKEALQKALLEAEALKENAKKEQEQKLIEDALEKGLIHPAEEESYLKLACKDFELAQELLLALVPDPRLNSPFESFHKTDELLSDFEQDMLLNAGADLKKAQQYKTKGMI